MAVAPAPCARDLHELLEPGEEVRLEVRATEAIITITDRRVVVAAPHRVALAVPFDRLRRVEFDIERNRPATLVLVPELARDEPQILAIPQEHYQSTVEALVALGLALGPIDSGETPEEWSVPSASRAAHGRSDIEHARGTLLDSGSSREGRASRRRTRWPRAARRTARRRRARVVRASPA